MELDKPINFTELLKKPILFRIERNVDNCEENDIFNEDPAEEFDDKKVTSPWLHCFDELKKEMSVIPRCPDIYKRTIVEGNGDVLGVRLCRIQWTYSMFFESEEYSFDTSYSAGNTVRTTQSDEIIPGAWLGLETMRKGEEAQFIIGYKKMFGEQGDMNCPFKVKPKADVLLVTKLVDFEEVGSADACEQLTDEDLHHYPTVKLKAIEMQKKLNELYRERRYSQAILLCLDIIQRIQFCDVQDDDVEKDKHQFLTSVYVKLIDCYVRRDKFQKAVGAVKQMRQLANVEEFVDVLVNEAVALSKVSDDYNTSIKLLRRAQQLYPRNELVHKTLNDLCSAREKYNNETKNFMMKAFQQKPKPQISPKPSAQREEVNAKLTEIIKSFKNIEIGHLGIPLIGYTPDELQLVKEAIQQNADYKLQAITNHDGKVHHVIKRST